MNNESPSSVEYVQQYRFSHRSNPINHFHDTYQAMVDRCFGVFLALMACGLFIHVTNLFAHPVGFAFACLILHWLVLLLLNSVNIAASIFRWLSADK